MATHEPPPRPTARFRIRAALLGGAVVALALLSVMLVASDSDGSFIAVEVLFGVLSVTWLLEDARATGLGGRR